MEERVNEAANGSEFHRLLADLGRSPLSFRPSDYPEILVMQREERPIEPDVAQDLEVDCDGDLYMTALDEDELDTDFSFDRDGNINFASSSKPDSGNHTMIHYIRVWSMSV